MAKKRQIKIRFVDFWDDFNNKPNVFTDAQELEVVNKAD